VRRFEWKHDRDRFGRNGGLVGDGFGRKRRDDDGLGRRCRLDDRCRRRRVRARCI
jgi:hypothetical protein